MVVPDMAYFVTERGRYLPTNLPDGIAQERSDSEHKNSAIAAIGDRTGSN